MPRTFDIDDLVWAKFLNYRPWPGRIKRQTCVLLKPDHLCVQFYGNDDYSQVLISNIYPYLDKVDEFTANFPKAQGSCFGRAANTIHEKYWNSIDLKRESEDSGFPVDTDEEIEIAIEDRKAGRWNSRVFRRPLPERRRDDDADDNDDDDNNDEEDYPVYPNSNWGRSTRSTRSKKKRKGESTEVQTILTKTQNSGKTTGSKTLICENSEASTSKVTNKNTLKVVTRTRKTSQTLSLPEQKSCEISQPSTSKGINKVISQVVNKKGKSSQTISLTEQEVNPSTSTTSCLNNSSCDIIAPETYSSPFQHLSLNVQPVSDVPIPQDSCSGCNIRYGFIGLSSLSQSIIYPLVKGGHTVNIWSKDASKFNALTKAGAVRTNTPAGIITSSDVIFYCTRDPDITKNILLTREGVFDGCERSLGRVKIFIELTNIDVVEPERSIRPLIKFQRGYYMQVKTIIPQIGDKASQVFICAGNQNVYAEVSSCLYHVTRNIHYFGPEFFKDCPLNLTPQIVEELVLQSLQKTTSYLYDLGFNVPQFEKIVCHNNFEFGKLAAKLKQCNEAKRNEKMIFYQDM